MHPNLPFSNIPQIQLKKTEHILHTFIVLSFINIVENYDI
ncbi:hypothetical protein Tu3298_002109 [Staphylococcus epidermidis]